MSRDVLSELAAATRAVREAERRRMVLIEEALSEGHSERVVGHAAGVSGPAINQFKARRALEARKVAADRRRGKPITFPTNPRRDVRP